MLLIGYFEGLDSERGIAWRAADSLSLRHFPGYALEEKTPDHSTISRTRPLLWVLKQIDGQHIRSYIPELERGRRNWQGKREEQQQVYANRRRLRGERSKRLQKLRCETGRDCNTSVRTWPRQSCVCAERPA